MHNLIGVVACLFLCACATPKGENVDTAVRLKFVPGSPPSSPLESTKGAVWSALRSFPNPDSDRLSCEGWVAVDEKFPVKVEGGPTLFEVRLKDGNDKRVSVEILSEEGTEVVQLRRDEPKEVEVGGVKYKLSFPTLRIAAKARTTTTPKAMLQISTPRT